MSLPGSLRNLKTVPRSKPLELIPIGMPGFCIEYRIAAKGAAQARCTWQKKLTAISNAVSDDDRLCTAPLDE